MAKLCKFSSLYFIGLFINYLCIVAVNCFVLISGYFLVNREIDTKKLSKLWCQVLFYSLLILLFASYYEIVDFNFTLLFRTLFPITSNLYWFISVLDKTYFKYCLFCLIFIFSIIPSINIFAAQFKISYGYSFT